MMSDKKFHKPITMILAGFLAGGLVTFLSLGLLTPLGAALLGLSSVFAGLWILTNSQNKWTQLLGITLLVSPFFITLAFLVRFIRAMLS